MKNFLFSVLVLFSTTFFAQSWVKLADAPVGRHHPISFSLNGKGYAITGTLSNNQPTDDAYEYNPVTNTWRTIGDFPGAARSFGIGVVANGKAYLGFGANAQYLKDFWSFDATDSSWTRLADCGCAGRRHPAMIAIGDRIYVGLGDNNISGNLRDWWMYDINDDTWTQIANLPGPARHHPFMFNAGGEVFAGMGHGSNVIYNDWYKLDTASNTWSAMNNFPGEGRVAGTQFSANGYGYVLSGDGSNHGYMDQGEMWQYNPNTDTWSELTPHPGKSRWAPGSFVIDSNVYFFGGRNRFTGMYPNNLWKFNIKDTTTGITEEKLVLKNTYVYPNPSKGVVSWKNDRSITDVKIYNSLGQLLLTTPAEVKKVDAHHLSNGLYFVQFYAKSKLLKTTKVLVENQ